MDYFDVHTHINFHAFDHDYREVIGRAKDAGVSMIIAGTQCDTSARAVSIANEYSEDVYAAVGLHPVHTDRSFHDEEELGGGEAAKAFTSRGEVFDFERYKTMALDKKTVAIGECGLDYYRMSDKENATRDMEEKKQKQKDAFIEHIKLAHTVRKPLMIHCRNASRDIVDILIACRDLLLPIPGVMHFYTDGIEDAKKLINMGFYFSVGGVITFTRDYDELVKMIPTGQLLTETDAPLVAPVPYRGKRNEPAYIVETAKKLAEIRGIMPEEMARSTTENAKRIFRL